MMLDSRRVRTTSWMIAMAILGSCGEGESASPRPASDLAPQVVAGAPRVPPMQVDSGPPPSVVPVDAGSQIQPVVPQPVAGMSQAGAGGGAGGAAAVPCSMVAEGAFALLSARCASCHGGNGRAEGGFGTVLNASDLVSSGRVISGRPAESPVYRRVQSGDMPRSGARLNATELGTLEAWINCGAPAPDVGPDNPPPVVPDDADEDEDVDEDADEAADEDADADEDVDEDADEAADEDADADEDVDEEAEEDIEDDEDDEDVMTA